MIFSVSVFVVSVKYEGRSHLFSSSVFLVQASADMSLLASLATEALLDCDHPNSHSDLLPAATALQYTTERRLGWMLRRDLHLLLRFVLVCLQKHFLVPVVPDAGGAQDNHINIDFKHNEELQSDDS